MHRIKFLALLRSVKKNYSIAASIDEEIQRFLKTEAKEAFTKQCVERKKTPTLQVISNAVKSIEKEAGVLVPICIVNKRPSLLFTVRARNLNSHGGEIRLVFCHFSICREMQIKPVMSLAALY